MATAEIVDRHLFRCPSCGAAVLADKVEQAPVCQGEITIGGRLVSIHDATAMVRPGGDDD